ncbi:MAG TPA: TIGR00725 family protein [Firmicutes bacterium]|nr:TIGR00725 family protein [Bacillota bacterium]
MLRIGVIGGSVCREDAAETAYQVGKKIAEMGAVLISGGLTGIMEYSAKGAKEAGGLTVGILPGGNEKTANKFIDIPIVTDMGHARNIIVVRSSDIIIAIEGSLGTLSEIALGLKIGKPIIGINTYDVDEKIYRAEDADAAFEIVNTIIAQGKNK